jgi:hypothetical protein
MTGPAGADEMHPGQEESAPSLSLQPHGAEVNITGDQHRGSGELNEGKKESWEWVSGLDYLTVNRVPSAVMVLAQIGVGERHIPSVALWRSGYSRGLVSACWQQPE